MRGHIDTFNNKRGFGFVVGEDGKSLFFHYSDIQSDGYKILRHGDIVEYEKSTNYKGDCAIKVRKI